jgi:hypothetical protein
MVAPAKPRAKKPAAPRAKRKGTPRVVPRNGGRKPWQPNDEQRMFVTALSGRATQETIARVLGTTVDTLVKHCREELNGGQEVAYAHIDSALFKKAMAGDTTAIIWYEKSRRRFHEVTAHEHSGPNGAPIEHRDMSGYTDDQLALLEQAAKLLGGRDTGSDGES